jgi:hypothetical protein
MTNMKSGLVRSMLVCCLAIGAIRPAHSQPPRMSGLEQILDTYVRDGLVYYRALKAERGRLDAYVNSLASVPAENRTKEDQAAFWVNAYNAIVLQTVVDHYPIAQRSHEYPAHSIRQIPGAFERNVHRVAGRTITLDDIEKTVLPTFGDPRIFLALGRGAVGSPRLRSEPYSGGMLQHQLEEAATECVRRGQCATVQRSDNRVSVSPIFSWREADFVAAYADKADPAFRERSSIEKAVLTFISPALLSSEREFLKKNEFRVEYVPFDWALNDLTGRGGR